MNAINDIKEYLINEFEITEEEAEENTSKNIIGLAVHQMFIIKGCF